MAITIDQGPDDAPDRITGEEPPKRSFGQRLSDFKRAFTTKEGLLGTYDYGEIRIGALPLREAKTDKYSLLIHA